MSIEILVALITAIGGIIVAGIAAYASARQAHRKELAEIKEIIIRNQLKVDTLWEIYAEDAIKSAQKGGYIASQSAVRPTEKLKEVMSPELQKAINDDTIELAKYLHSAEDISIEIWAKHKEDLLLCSYDANMSVKETWGSLITIIQTILYDSGYLNYNDMFFSITNKS